MRTIAPNFREMFIPRRAASKSPPVAPARCVTFESADCAAVSTVLILYKLSNLLDDDECYVVVCGCGAGEFGESGFDFVADG